jgi:hypothetical protein
VFVVGQLGLDGVLHNLERDDCEAFEARVVDQLDVQIGFVVVKLKAVDVDWVQHRLDA